MTATIAETPVFEAGTSFQLVHHVLKEGWQPLQSIAGTWANPTEKNFDDPVAAVGALHKVYKTELDCCQLMTPMMYGTNGLNAVPEHGNPTHAISIQVCTPKGEKTIITQAQLDYYLQRERAA